jgi:uncharacterized damage-inducible protein DinB
MVFNTVGDIYQEIDLVRDGIHDRVKGLTQEQACYRLKAEAWSVIELVEHVCKSEEALTVQLSTLLTKAEAQGRPGMMPPFSLDDLSKLADGKKFSAPDVLRPVGDSTLAELLARMRENREALRALRSRLEALDASEVTHSHPAFGPLNPYQWLAFTGRHERRHLGQIEAIMASPSFPAQ